VIVEVIVVVAIADKVNNIPAVVFYGRSVLTIVIVTAIVALIVVRSPLYVRIALSVVYILPI